MTTSERIYRILLKAYPVAYLREYREPMAQAFRDQLRDAASSRSNRFHFWIRFWMRMLLDWAKTVLTTHVAARPDDTRAKAVFFARYETCAYSHPEVTPEDLLLGALRADAAFADRILDAGIADIRSELEPSAPIVPRMATAHAALSESCKRALQFAEEEAVRSGAPRTTARHLIAGILHESESLAARVLQQHGIDLSRLR